MKKYFDQLRPMERRVVLFVGVALFVALNWVFVWPYFSDWSNYTVRYGAAQTKLKLYQTAIAQEAGDGEDGAEI